MENLIIVALVVLCVYVLGRDKRKGLSREEAKSVGQIVANAKRQWADKTSRLG